MPEGHYLPVMQQKQKVLINSEVNMAFETNVGVWQELLLWPTLCNVFPENIMAEEKETGVIVEGMRVKNLGFTDEIKLIPTSSSVSY